jgi:hypothetical protein
MLSKLPSWAAWAAHLRHLSYLDAEHLLAEHDHHWGVGFGEKA